MTEEEARNRVKAEVDAAAFAKLERFVELVTAENQRQNLISPATVAAIWDRHVVDSLQLRALVSAGAGRWLDIGTGGGFPGMVLAIAGCTPMLMVEPRRKRADFLRDCVAALGIADAEVATSRVEQVTWTADVITARAVASVDQLLDAAKHCATPTTRWLLPRGTVDEAVLPDLCKRHRLMFHVKKSLTRADSAILVLEPCA